LESISNSDFDLDFRNGKQGENLVARVLGVDTVEVKRDLMWFKTGNLYIETMCWSKTKSTWVPSGLRTTKSQWWFWVLGDTVIAVKTKQLKQLINEQWENQTIREKNNCHPPNPSIGYLIKIKDLLEFQKKKGYEITEFDTPEL
jgi:hypothetical protein